MHKAHPSAPQRKPFKTASGQTLYMQWAEATHELGRRLEAFREIQNAAGDGAKHNPTKLADELFVAFGNRTIMGIDVVDADNNLRGMVLYTRPHRGMARVASLWCDEEFRKQDVATRMMGRALGHMRSLGVRSAFTSIGAINKPSRNFFHKTGWSFTGNIQTEGDTRYWMYRRPLRNQTYRLEESSYD